MIHAQFNAQEVLTLFQLSPHRQTIVRDQNETMLRTN